MVTLTSRDLERLAEHPFFRAATPDQRDELMRLAAPLAYDDRNVIYRHGDVYTGFYLVLEGSVQLYRCTSHGRCLVLRIVRTGESFGESPLVGTDSPSVYHTAAETLAATRLLSFAQADVRDFLGRHPKMCQAMLRSVSSGLIGLLDRFELVTLYNVKGRLARHLLALAECAGTPSPMHLDVPKSVLAAQLGTIPETLSRAFRQLRKAGCITTSGRIVGILDRGLLEEYARGSID